MANIRDVARRAGVSIATVSHVFNGTRSVSEEVRNRVTQAAADLQYYPNHLARSLTTKRTGTVGMVVSDMSNPFFAEIIRGFEATLRPQQYNLIVCNTEDDRSREEEALRLLMGKRVDGIAAAVTSEKWATLQAAQNRAFPLVFLDLKVEGVQGPLVCGDNDLGAYQGVSHLIADGHTRISILAGMPGMSSMRDRLSGYRRALAEHGLPYDEAYVKFSRLDIAHGARQMDALLAQEPRPDAVFISNNLLALGALHALQQSTLFCPEDIALSCFDDAPWMMISDPPLTAVRQPNYDMGALAARFLLQQIHGETVPRTTITLQPELIVRQSCRADRHGAQMGHPRGTSGRQTGLALSDSDERAQATVGTNMKTVADTQH